MRTHGLPSIVLSALILAACTGAPAATPHSSMPQATPAATAVSSDSTGPAILPNLLVMDKAQVAVRRQGSAEFVPVTLGAEVAPGDLIMISSGKAAVFCGNEADWDSAPLELKTGERAGVPCGVGRPPRSGPGTTWLRGETAADTPLQVLSPRTGSVLSTKPNLAWQGVAGAASYTVTLQSDDGQLRTPLVVDGTSVAFPEAWAPLEGEGAEYSLFIAASNGITSGATSGIGFLLLEPGEQKMVEAQAAHLRRRPLDETALTLLLANLYLAYDLRSEAVEMVAALPQAADTAAVQQLLGDTYLEMGLPAQAEAAYTRLLQLATAEELGEDEAAAYLGLGHAACDRRQPAAAAQAWQQALARYTQMGLPARITAVEALLAEREKRCSS